MQKLGAQKSQLKNCKIYQDSLGQECFAVKASTASSSLEVQDMTLGKYLITWARLEAENLEEMAATSTYELSSVKVCQSSLYAEAKIPAFAVARVPFGVVFSFTNRTEVVLEFNMMMESSEAFMLSGNKQQHFKIPPKDTFDLHYVFYPLLAGEAVPLPKPKLTSLRPALPHDDVGAALQRLLPSSILSKYHLIFLD